MLFEESMREKIALKGREGEEEERREKKKKCKDSILKIHPKFNF